VSYLINYTLPLPQAKAFFVILIYLHRCYSTQQDTSLDHYC
jgi:hypothetical protein